MGKLFINQPVTFNAEVEADITGADPVIIKYKKPGGDTGSWSATITDAENGKIKYETTALENGGIDEIGLWTLWAHVTLSDGRQIPGEAWQVTVYDEGT